LNATATAPQSSDVANVHVIACAPAVACNRYCPLPPNAPRSFVKILVPVCAEGAHVCAPLATDAKITAPLTVGVSDVVVGFVETPALPVATSNADVNVAPAFPLAPTYEIDNDPEFGIENVPLAGVPTPAMYQISVLASGDVVPLRVELACVIVTPLNVGAPPARSVAPPTISIRTTTVAPVVGVYVADTMGLVAAVASVLALP